MDDATESQIPRYLCPLERNPEIILYFEQTGEQDAENEGETCPACVNQSAGTIEHQSQTRMPPTDEQFIQIYRDTVARLYRFVSVRLAHRPDVVEDIVQETYLRAVHSWTTSLPREPLAWLHTVAGNLVQNYFRARKPAFVSAREIDSWFSCSSSHDHSHANDLIYWGLGQIKRERAALLQEFYFDKYSMSEIGKRRGITSKAVERRLARARRELRSKIRSYVTE